MYFLRDHKRGLHEASLHHSVLQCVAIVLQLCCSCVAAVLQYISYGIISEGCMKEVCIAVCCSVLQLCCRCAAVSCIVYVAVYFSVLQYVVAVRCCSALLQCIVAMCLSRSHTRWLHEASLHCSVLQCVAAVLQVCCRCVAVSCNVCVPVHFSMLLCVVAARCCNVFLTGS